MKTTYLLYNDTVKIEFSDFGHKYIKKDISLDSVTGITGVINKPALIGWAVKECVEYMREKIKPGVPLDEIELIGLFNEAKIAHTKSKDKSADIGVFVHDWVRKYIRGEKPEMPINQQVVISINSFLNWEKNHNVVFKCAEQVVYSKKYNYAGTFDNNAIVDNDLTLLDLKTSSGVYDEMFAQLAGYEQARVEEFPQEIYKKRGILWISRNGDFDFVESKYPKEALDMFMGAREIYKVQKFYKQKYLENKKQQNFES